MCIQDVVGGQYDLAVDEGVVLESPVTVLILAAEYPVEVVLKPAV